MKRVPFGNTSLMETRDPKWTAFLLKHGADKNIKDRRGQTALDIVNKELQHPHWGKLEPRASHRRKQRDLLSEEEAV